MKKKILFIVCLLGILVLFGCNKEEGSKQQERKLAEDEIVSKDIMYKFDQEASEYGIKFKLASNLRRVDNGNAISYFSEEIDGNSNFVFRIFHLKNKDMKAAITDTTQDEYEKKWETKVGDINYTVVHFTNPIGDNVKTNIYYYEHNNDVYAYCFTSNEDLSRLEQIFLKSIKYE